jgi:hypothetical protein
MLWHFLLAFHRAREGVARKEDLFVLGAWPIVFGVAFTQAMPVSASPNLAVAGGAVICGWLLLASPGGGAVLIAGALAAVKLTALPLLLIAAVLRRNAVVISLAVLLAAPLVLANRVTTGCPFYPAAVGCEDRPDAVGKAKAQSMERETRDWARYVERLPENTRWWSLDWLGIWFRRPTNTVLFLVAVLSVVALTARKAWGAAPILGLSGFVWTMSTVPDFRLGCGFVALLAGGAAAAVLRSGALVGIRIPVATLVCGLIVLEAAARDIGYVYILHDDRARPHLSRLFVPAEIRRPTVIPVAGSGVNAVAPSAGQSCWGARLPCMIEPAEAGLRYCQPEMGARGGFCRTPLSRRVSRSRGVS